MQDMQEFPPDSHDPGPGDYSHPVNKPPKPYTHPVNRTTKGDRQGQAFRYYRRHKARRRAYMRAYMQAYRARRPT